MITVRIMSGIDIVKNPVYKQAEKQAGRKLKRHGWAKAENKYCGPKAEQTWLGKS